MPTKSQMLWRKRKGNALTWQSWKKAMGTIRQEVKKKKGRFLSSLRTTEL